MSRVIRIAGLFVIFALAACDASNSVGVAGGSSQAAPSDNVVYFPDGGGIEFPMPPVKGDQGSEWKAKEFIVDDDLVGLNSALVDTMQEQGYVRLESLDLQGFEQVLSFSKKGSVKKVSYRMKRINSTMGEKILLRLSWNI